MFTVQEVKPDANGEMQVRFVDAEWDYRDDRHNWTRAISFLPFDARIWIRTDARGNVMIEYMR